MMSHAVTDDGEDQAPHHTERTAYATFAFAQTCLHRVALSDVARSFRAQRASGGCILIGVVGGFYWLVFTTEINSQTPGTGEMYN
jgi:hypothetical protein